MAVPRRYPPPPHYGNMALKRLLSKKADRETRRRRA